MKFEFSPSELDIIENHRYLTRRERRVFALYFREGLNYEQVGAELEPQVCRRTVYNILKSIRKKVIRII